MVAYDYNVLWLSFRPTFWVWGLFIAGSIIYAIWRRPKGASAKKTAVPRLSAGLSPDNVRAFTEAYEERRNITHEMRVLHARVQKGKIPRNYYKSQRKNLETRLAALSKNINQLKGTFRAAGGSYADLVRQLDSGESELEKARATVRTAEARHKTGEMPIEEYKKALADYEQKREKIDLQINGILLRLREEIH
jgi:chromosome segregation ATPase